MATKKTNLLRKTILNKYVIVCILFLIWMIIFDENSFFMHQESDQQIQALQQSKSYYKELLKKEEKNLLNLENNPKEAEKIARELYYMHKENEEIFVIETKKQ